MEAKLLSAVELDAIRARTATEEGRARVNNMHPTQTLKDLRAVLSHLEAQAVSEYGVHGFE